MGSSASTIPLHSSSSSSLNNSNNNNIINLISFKIFLKFQSFISFNNLKQNNFIFFNNSYSNNPNTSYNTSYNNTNTSYNNNNNNTNNNSTKTISSKLSHKRSYKSHNNNNNNNDNNKSNKSDSNKSNSSNNLNIIQNNSQKSYENNENNNNNNNNNENNPLVNLSDINLNKSLIIYISHSWLQIDKTNEFQPDNNENEKLKLCQDGIKLLLSSLIDNNELECYVWIDYCCADINDQDHDYIENLDEVLQLSDMLFTPIPTDETRVNIPLIGGDMLKEYRIKLWNGTKYAYINRDICRWELYLGSTVPLSTYSNEKQPYYLAGLKEMAKVGKRIHFLYDSNMKSKNYTPISLPISSKSFQTILPKICYSHRTTSVASSSYLLSERQATIRNLLLQKSSAECDPIIGPKDENSSSNSTEEFVEPSSVPNIHQVQEVFDSHLSGFHIHKTPDGNIYEGEWSCGKWNGNGKLISNIGAVTIGCWDNGVLNGYGTYIFPQGDIYEGEWLNSQWHGKGTLTLINGDKYIGEFRQGIKCGHGTLESSHTGKVYIGEWNNNLWNGNGKLTLNNGDIYEGNYHNGQLNGQGIYLKPSIESYEGEWCDDKWNGYGIYTIFRSNNHPTDIIQEGYWENGNLIPEYTMS